MIVLNATNEEIIISVDGAATTDEATFFCSFRTRTSTTFEADNQTGQTNSVSAQVVCPSPASGEQNLVDYINVFNIDTVSHTYTIQWWDGSNFSTLHVVTLESGAKCEYIEGAGWVDSNTYKDIKSFTVHGDAGANFAMTNATLAERFAGNTTRHIFSVDLLGYTQVRLRVNKMVVGTAGSLFRAKYYTSYNTTVTNYLQLGASSQVETSMAATGYYDSGWVDLASGAKINGCYIAFTELGGDGVADPAIGATDILFR